MNALEEQVNISNQNLRAAQAQYTQARAPLRYKRADYFPTVAAGVSATRGRTSAIVVLAALVAMLLVAVISVG